MPRSARSNSLNDSKIYHIIVKGINSQEIFFEDEDKAKFLNLIKVAKKSYLCEILAYVLMDNHVHLIVYDEQEKISQIMHRICTVYAMYFNKKYERIGHLFQNRFKSICVNTEKYLLNLQRYIHANPQKDGICKIEKYKWSSYHEYVTVAKIADTNFILDIFDDNRERAIQKFIEYNQKYDIKSECEAKEFEIRRNLTDEEAIYKIKIMLEIDNIMEILNFNRTLRDRYIKEIAQIEGISRKQIARILGISIRTIQRAINGK